MLTNTLILKVKLLNSVRIGSTAFQGQGFLSAVAREPQH